MDLDIFQFLLKENNYYDRTKFSLISNQTYIDELIESVYKTQKGITLFLGTTKKSFKTFISNVDLIPDIREFETDHISFLNLYKSKFNTKNLSVVFNQNSIYYGFSAKFIRFSKKNQIILEMPEKIYKLQRRRFVRVKQSVTMPIDIQLAPYYKDEQREKFETFLNFWQQYKDQIKFSVVDISEGGIGITFEAKKFDYEELTFPIFRVRLFFQGNVVEAIAQKQSFVEVSKRGELFRYRVGLSFVSISKSSQTEIKRYIMVRQTEILRNRKTD